jgi:hypothetical protein
MEAHRVLVTSNIGDFARLHRDWMTLGRHHAGIIAVAQTLPLRSRLRRMRVMLNVLEEIDFPDRLHFLRNWPEDHS